jgi:hypothetical protein
MERPDLATFACVNPACPLFRHAGQGNLVIRKVYGRDEIRLLRCRTCCEAFSERRGSALGSVANFDFGDKIQKPDLRNSMAYRPQNSRKSKFATEPSHMPRVGADGPCLRHL